MAKSLRILAGVLAAFLGLSVMHVWLNVGFDKFAMSAAGKAADKFRVGFLPVT
jgi:hypothetical protein